MALASKDTAGLHAALLDVSDPKSADYGKHLSKDEANTFLAPAPMPSPPRRSVRRRPERNVDEDGNDPSAFRDAPNTHVRLRRPTLSSEDEDSHPISTATTRHLPGNHMVPSPAPSMSTIATDNL
ncbi:hypothetical protein FB45DRAFT_1024186 [Roridomyces roridus]|uniref:Peptidase S53 activation domain-containing protein n=1 Tax=Roridomyces roridus TaxID=1738132 RepID=A0AAD7FV85_9AGAR|nr:hypothetical protein FB45DRAFT_1024186 [Roridomyces roridus]